MPTVSEYNIGASNTQIERDRARLTNLRIGGVYNYASIKGYRDRALINNFPRYGYSRNNKEFGSLGERIGEIYSLNDVLNRVSRNGIEGSLDNVGGIIGYTESNRWKDFLLNKSETEITLQRSFINQNVPNALRDNSLYYIINDIIPNSIDTNPNRKYNYLYGLLDYTQNVVKVNGDGVLGFIQSNNKKYSFNTISDSFPYKEAINSANIRMRDSFGDTYTFPESFIVQAYYSKDKQVTLEKYAKDKEFADTLWNLIKGATNDTSAKFGVDNFTTDNISYDSESTIYSESPLDLYEKEDTIDSVLRQNSDTMDYARKNGLWVFTHTKLRGNSIMNSQPKIQYGLNTEENGEEIERYSVNNENNNLTGETISLNPTYTEGGFIDKTGLRKQQVTHTLYNESNGNEGREHTIENNNGVFEGDNARILRSQENASALIKKTNDLFSKGKIHSIANRFFIKIDGDKEDFETAYDTTYGFSRGRNLRKASGVDKINSYDNPYCRVWTTHHQYSHLKDRIRPFVKNNDGAFQSVGETQKDYGNFRPYNGAKRLQENTVLQDSGFVRIGPTKTKEGKLSSIKNYMFSIENLAWKDVLSTEDGKKNLSAEQIGPNGGRIMWFPPYDLKFSDNVSANWNANSFIGRGEKIYTYTDTDRSGTLSFTLLIDHPASVDLWERNGTDGDETYEREQEILRYFAGCGDLNIPQPPAKESDNTSGITSNEPTNTPVLDKATTQIKYVIFFPNDFSSTNYNTEETIYKLKQYEYEDKQKWDERDIDLANEILLEKNKVNHTSEDLLNNSEGGKWKNKAQIEKTLGIDDKCILYSFADLINLNGLSSVVGNQNSQYEISSVEVQGFASSHGIEEKNKKLCKRRAATIAKIFKYKTNISNDKIITKEGSIISVEDVSGVPDVNTMQAKIARSAIATVNISLKSGATPDNTVNETTIKNNNRNKNGSRLNRNSSNTNNTTTNNTTATTTNDEADIEKEVVLEEGAIYRGMLRDAQITARRIIRDRVFEGYSEGSTYDNEYQYFKQLEYNDSMLFKNIVKKIKYFDPAYHSITPEGFNARLTFLHQCTRQGPTQSIADTNGESITAGNLAFGRAPYCILRIGDFFHTKIAIDSLSIDYSNGDGIQWDLNPEGAGVQPMMAKVNINFKFLGGQDIGGPVERLQNAVTYNYYANTSIYDRHADHLVPNDNVVDGERYKENWQYNAMNATKRNILEKKD